MSDTRSYTTQSEEDSSDAGLSSPYKRSSPESLLGILDMICLCYMGVMLLRLPITIAEFHSWISTGDMLYYRSTRILDPQIRRRLPRRYLQRLNPPHELHLNKLHTALVETLIMFNSTFGLDLPAINVTLILYRWIDSLVLPPECFAATMALARLLERDFKYDLASRPSDYNMLRIPETRLLCYLVTATKILFPDDDNARVARRPTELAATVLDWSSWSKLRNTIKVQRAKRTHMSYKEAMALTDADVMGLSPLDIDQYLDYYESNYIESAPRGGIRARRQSTFRGNLRSMFPGQDATILNADPDQHVKDESVLKRMVDDATDVLQSTLLPRTFLANEDVTTLSRPGSSYTAFKSPHALTDHMRLLYSEAACISGLSVEVLVKATSSIDRQLHALQQRAVRKT